MGTGVDKPAAQAMMQAMHDATATNTGRTCGDFTVATADMFDYTDPVDGSVSRNQGVRILFTDGSRVVFRLSGTGTEGATLRVYLERYVGTDGDLGMATGDALAPLIAAAQEVADIAGYTGMDQPSVIT